MRIAGLIHLRYSLIEESWKAFRASATTIIFNKMKAACPDDRRSTTAYSVFLSTNLLSWGTKKKAAVSRSSAEAEYKALAVTASELL